MPIDYKKAGVNKKEGYRAVDLMKKYSKMTYNENVLNGLGSFGAIYEIPKYKNPVLVSGTDGVGTKLEIAFKMKKYDTVGIDAVAMCVNDVLCHGAKPLFFLDYLACGKLDARVASELVAGVSKGCLDSYASLIGGETAEMPGFYKDGDYDIAGFCVGIVEKENIINGNRVNEGDSIIGIASSGFHSNGFSLIRSVIKDYDEVFRGKKIGDILLTPTKIYVKPVLKLLEKFNIKGMAHITGGGLIENVPRGIKKGYEAVISKSSFKNKIKTKEIFKLIQERGNISENEMYNTFNMGIGFVLIVDKNDKDKILNELKKLEEEAFEIGYVRRGENGICLI